MNKTIMTIVGIIAFIVVVAGIIIATTVGARNTALSLEERVKAQHVANKSNYDGMWKAFKEAAQVTDKQAEQFKSVYEDMITGRYEGDEEVLFKTVQEQNPELNQEVYARLQNLIVSGRKEFDNNQKKVTDIIREYNAYIRKHFVMNAIFRFEVLDANDYIVTSERTEGAFESGKDESINLNE